MTEKDVVVQPNDDIEAESVQVSQEAEKTHAITASVAGRFQGVLYTTEPFSFYDIKEGKFTYDRNYLLSLCRRVLEIEKVVIYDQGKAIFEASAGAKDTHFTVIDLSNPDAEPEKVARTESVVDLKRDYSESGSVHNAGAEGQSLIIRLTKRILGIEAARATGESTTSKASKLVLETLLATGKISKADFDALMLSSIDKVKKANQEARKAAREKGVSK